MSTVKAVSPHGMSQAVYKAHMQFGEDNPDAMQLSLDVQNKWGRGEVTLGHAIGQAILDAWNKGVDGEPLTHAPVHPKFKFVRRTK